MGAGRGRRRHSSPRPGRAPPPVLKPFKALDSLHGTLSITICLDMITIGDVRWSRVRARLLRERGAAVATLPTGLQGASDSALIEAVRDGSTDAYAQLYERHVDAAFNMARTVTRSTPDADDLVADAFARVLDMLRAGRGPTDAFRAYLLTTIRHSAYDRTRRTRERPAEDIGELAGAELSEPFTDTTLAALERSLVTRAFQRLPERWQAALWYVVIEQQQPADVAGFFGLTPNGVSALVYRAREGLRQEYLQVHLGQLDTEGGSVRCRSTVKRLGAWTRGKLAKRETAQVETHLDHCERCHALSAELLAINGALRGTLPPVLLGIAVTSGYFATVSGSGNAAAGLDRKSVV